MSDGSSLEIWVVLLLLACFVLLSETPGRLEEAAWTQSHSVESISGCWSGSWWEVWVVFVVCLFSDFWPWLGRSREVVWTRENSESASLLILRNDDIVRRSAVHHSACSPEPDCKCCGAVGANLAAVAIVFPLYWWSLIITKFSGDCPMVEKVNKF